MKPITYDCATCLAHYVLWDDSKPAISTQRYNDLVKLVSSKVAKGGGCNKCVRKDPNVCTTLEMDRLFDAKDIRERFFVMKPCIDCLKYNQQDVRKPDKPCIFCKGLMTKTSNYWYSIRTFKDDKKLSAADRKKMGERK